MFFGASTYVYNSISLYFYDLIVHWFMNGYVWRCSTYSVLLPLFQANAGPRHMDVGVGTGFFPTTVRQLEKATSDWPKKIVFVDLNRHCLSKVSNRLGLPERTMCLQADALQPFPERGPFDSISLMYLIHCLPGPTERKAQMFSNLKNHLTDDGTLFGVTVLGEGVQHDWISRTFMWVLNALGAFDNHADGKEPFLEVLGKEFEEVESSVIGRVLIFTARKPKRS